MNYICNKPRPKVTKIKLSFFNDNLLALNEYFSFCSEEETSIFCCLVLLSKRCVACGTTKHCTVVIIIVVGYDAPAYHGIFLDEAVGV